MFVNPASENEIIMWIPSNTSNALYTNTTSSFHVQLPKELALTGCWEVALTECFYPHNFPNLRQDAWLVLISQKPIPGTDSHWHKTFRDLYGHFFRDLSLAPVSETSAAPKLPRRVAKRSGDSLTIERSKRSLPDPSASVATQNGPSLTPAPDEQSNKAADSPSRPVAPPPASQEGSGREGSSPAPTAAARSGQIAHNESSDEEDTAPQPGQVFEVQGHVEHGGIIPLAAVAVGAAIAIFRSQTPPPTPAATPPARATETHAAESSQSSAEPEVEKPPVEVRAPTGTVRPGIVEIPIYPSYYNSTEEFFAYVNSCLDLVDRRQLSERKRFRFYLDNHRETYSFGERGDMVLFSSGQLPTCPNGERRGSANNIEELSNIFGIRSPCNNGRRFLSCPINDASYGEINQSPAIFVYCDFVDYCFVGDKEVPLLRAVPVSGRHGDIVHHVFEEPYYRPVTRAYLKSMEFELKSDTGENFPFRGGKVILVLKFRRTL